MGIAGNSLFLFQNLKFARDQMHFLLLSHRSGNIGHTFMAVGMEQILRKTFGQQLKIEHIEQHNPFDVYPAMHLLRWIGKGIHGPWSSSFRAILSSPLVEKLGWPTSRRFSDVALAIACGGPNIVPGAGNNPFLKLLFHHMLGALHYQGVPVIDAAVGSCFPWSRIPERISDPVDRAYFQRQFSFCKGLTVRDTLAQSLWRDLGAEPLLIPCASLACGYVMEGMKPALPGQYILINFQKHGANTDWGQGVDVDTWRATMERVIHQLSQQLPVHMLCHNETEVELARSFGKPIHKPKNIEEYGALARGAAVAIVSRLHAALPLAGAGVPSLLIGTDSRLLSGELVGLPILFVQDATVERVVSTAKDILEQRNAMSHKLQSVRDSAVQSYGKVFSSLIRA